MKDVHDRIAELALEVSTLAHRYQNPWLYRCRDALIDAEKYEEEAAKWAKTKARERS
jgi:hypothetical protein